ncbi:MAG: 16S rRNA (guanine(527)-N(7))-methyltransferase RsmG [Treponema sp.]|jgi:16S rRNA (guanine527-N7)-methyltransferase|nr:16S rRNA (guanine(527)-N(7))-methyltransferase RsmG [Treponema sp.]
MEYAGGQNSVLSRGLLQLCKNNIDIDRTVTPRRAVIVSLLAKYIAEIELFNPAYGLVGTSDRRELVIKHILDSLTPLGVISDLLEKHEGGTPLQAADVGSGAGLPGIPLAIALPHVSFTLIERMGRRAGFLRNTRAALALDNITVEETGLEKAAGNPAMAGRFSLVTFRAFRPLEPEILKALFKLCGANGTLAAYKGRREKIEAEMSAAEQSRPELAGHWEAVPCSVPFLDEERHLVLIHPPPGT